MVRRAEEEAVSAASLVLHMLAYCVTAVCGIHWLFLCVAVTRGHKFGWMDLLPPPWPIVACVGPSFVTLIMLHFSTDRSDEYVIANSFLSAAIAFGVTHLSNYRRATPQSLETQRERDESDAVKRRADPRPTEHPEEWPSDPPSGCSVWEHDGVWYTRVYGFLLATRGKTRRDAVVDAWNCTTDFGERQHMPCEICQANCLHATHPPAVDAEDIAIAESFADPRKDSKP